MNEAIAETVRKKREDEQSGTGSASERQKTYILMLAKTVGMPVDVSTIKDKNSASRFIENLKLLSRRMHGNAFDTKARDRRIAFGLATKLVFSKYVDRHKEVRRSEKFWHEVEELYREYQKRQEISVAFGSAPSRLLPASVRQALPPSPSATKPAAS